MPGKLFFSALSLIILALLATSPLVVQAQEKQKEPSSAPVQPASPGQPDPLARYRQTGASQEQLNKITELGKEFDQGQKVRWQLWNNLTKQIRELAMQTDPDEKTVLAKQDEINKVVAEMAKERIKLMLHIRSVLTPEQKQKLVQLMQPKARPRPQPRNPEKDGQDSKPAPAESTPAQK